MASRDQALTVDKSEHPESSSPSERSRNPHGNGQHRILDDDPRLQLVERIATSEPFQKSSRLPPLIRYLARHSLNNDKAALTEHAIGRSVFAKTEDFTPADDSSVRVYMRQLRLRLHEFYQSTGRDEPIVVEVPKGGYALTFHAAPAPEQPAPSAAAVLPPERSHTPAEPRWKSVLPWALLAFACLVGIAGWYRALHGSSPEANAPWPLSQVIHADKQTTVVLADASYSMRMLWNGDFTLEDYIHRDRMHQLVAKADSRDAPLLRYLESAQITSMADAHAAAVLAGLAGPSWRNLAFRSAKDLTSSMLSRDDVIFIGSRTSNPWVELYDSRLNFPLVQVPGSTRYVANRAPLPGEQKAYTVMEVTGESGEDYATISLLPNTAAPGSVMIVQGIRLEGTDAAIRFLGDADRRAELEQRLKAVNGGILPKAFEALLHAHSVAGSAVSIDCIAVRAIKG
ncbi:hypothetical protein [Terriglobus aquaticus]|uniref:OmpR/PhoB-type domain-containing protein n=1 Tax=Terriglobus aquaticus TaxID=940139 RepID=A0ABW9KK73_9BACT|nr:hypothetical protein [Terriglobus aquaticus]